MRFSAVVVALATLVSSVVAVEPTPGFAVMTQPTKDQKVPAGSSLEIKWTPGNFKGTVSITVMQGADPKSLDFGDVIATGIKNSEGEFTWEVPSTSNFKTYGFEIKLESDPSTFQRSFPFHITGGSSSSSSSGSASATAEPTNNSTSSSTSAVETTSSAAPTTSSKSSSAVESSTLVTKPTAAPSATPSDVPSDNSTVPTGSETNPSPTSGGTNSTGTGAPKPSGNAASSNAISGSLALVGGLVIALAL